MSNLMTMFSKKSMMVVNFQMTTMMISDLKMLPPLPPLLILLLMQLLLRHNRNVTTATKTQNF